MILQLVHTAEAQPDLVPCPPPFPPPFSHAGASCSSSAWVGVPPGGGDDDPNKDRPEDEDSKRRRLKREAMLTCIAVMLQLMFMSLPPYKFSNLFLCDYR